MSSESVQASRCFDEPRKEIFVSTLPLSRIDGDEGVVLLDLDAGECL